VILLNFFTAWKYNHPNGFYRKIGSHQLKGTRFVKLADRHYYIAGIDESNVYLASWNTRNKLLIVSLIDKDTVSKLTSADKKLSFDAGAHVQVENDTIDLLDGNGGMLLYTAIKDGHFAHPASLPFYTAALPISNRNTIIRVVAKNQLNTLMCTSNNKLTAFFPLERQTDGIFSTDGMLVRAEDTERFFYIYFYRNQFLCFNDSLKLLYKHRTIDTNSIAKIKISSIRSTHQLTLSSPPYFVNKLACANDQWLFVASGLVADNEISNVMKYGNPVDIYSIRDGQYHASLFMPDFQGQKLRDFRAYGNILVALYDDYLYIYKMKI
jgi:hypothetical protein